MTTAAERSQEKERRDRERRMRAENHPWTVEDWKRFHEYISAVKRLGRPPRVEIMEVVTEEPAHGDLHSPQCARTLAIESCPHHYGPYYDEAAATPCTCNPHKVPV